MLHSVRLSAVTPVFALQSVLWGRDETFLYLVAFLSASFSLHKFLPGWTLSFKNWSLSSDQPVWQLTSFFSTGRVCLFVCALCNNISKQYKHQWWLGKRAVSFEIIMLLAFQLCQLILCILTTLFMLFPVLSIQQLLPLTHIGSKANLLGQCIFNKSFL